ncbi:MAG: hypothetical protein ACKV2T_21370 [Kofleriaceae bacterium]
MKRQRLGIGIGLVIVVLALLFWPFGSKKAHLGENVSSAKVAERSATTAANSVTAGKNVDPRTQARG